MKKLTINKMQTLRDDLNILKKNGDLKSVKIVLNYFLFIEKYYLNHIRKANVLKFSIITKIPNSKYSIRWESNRKDKNAIDLVKLVEQ